MILIKLAWRNLFRNRKRSVITISSVVFAVFFAVILRALQFGAYQHMLNTIVRSYMGYIQLHDEGFWEERTIDHVIDLNEVDLSAYSEISAVAPRIESFALASIGNESRPVGILGLAPEEEGEFTRIYQQIVDGSLDASGNSVVIGTTLSELMQIGIGDTLALLSQGYHGSIASGLYPISGVVDLHNPELNRRTVVMGLKAAQVFYGLNDQVSTLVVSPKGDWEKTYDLLKREMNDLPIEVMSWQEMLPALKQLIQVDKAGGVFVLLILYAILTLGLLGTVVMLTEERLYEYGVLVAVGMSKRKLILTAITETIILSLAGVVIGIVLSLPVIYYFNFNPIDLSGQMKEAVEGFGFEALIPTSTDPSIYLTHGVIIVAIVLIVNIYSILRIRKLKVVKAMKT